MSSSERTEEFLGEVKNSFANNALVKLKLAGYHGGEVDLKSIDVKKIVVKGGDKFSFTFHYKTRDIIKNLIQPEAIGALRTALTAEFRSAQLATTGFDMSFERNGDKVRLKRTDVAGREAPSGDHDRAKNRMIDAGKKPYLHALKITGADGNVLNGSQDKFRQINKMVEIFAPLIQAIPGDVPRIVDMGAGKGYLTFALYDYLVNVAKRPVEMVGVEYRAELVELCNDIARQSGFDGLRFEQGSIIDYDASGADAVIALHACDTATDDAIFKGISSGASLITVAPCCHKQIRRQMESHPQPASMLDFLLRHGTFMERQAEMVTDGLRAMLLEQHGYKTKVFEFISDAHTPKNVLIVAEKQNKPADAKTVADKIAATKAFFGIDYHHLERLLDA
ncbi:MAG: SAM-dependent methyltransferase [Devosia sp.]|uniref:class I SAM-dependent methyltransferase n=1 Tax=Devosia sp. TaxID=1871048 RepID=UPI0026178993|nr:SAM-dependent methyltransferase [Devosia sp.]MDB5588671.1 SAM-dependent methyltransferase [Devosia sp.]